MLMMHEGAGPSLLGRMKMGHAWVEEKAATGPAIGSCTVGPWPVLGPFVGCFSCKLWVYKKNLKKS